MNFRLPKIGKISSILPKSPGREMEREMANVVVKGARTRTRKFVRVAERMKNRSPSPVGVSEFRVRETRPSKPCQNHWRCALQDWKPQTDRQKLFSVVITLFGRSVPFVVGIMVESATIEEQDSKFDGNVCS